RFHVVHFEATGGTAGAEVGLPSDEGKGSPGPHHRDDLLMDRIGSVPAGLAGAADTFARPGAVQRVSETFGHRSADDFLMVDGRSGGGPSVRERDKVALPVRHPQHQVSECEVGEDRKSTRLNSSHVSISYAVFCLKKKKPR